MNNRVMITGSFDPITCGHADIIARAAALFDEIYVVAFVNVEKKYMFTQKQRLEMLENATKEYDNVKAFFSSASVAEFVKENDIGLIIRGLRNPDEIEYEKMMADVNYSRCGTETMYMICKDEFKAVSSTIARERIKAGESLDGIIPHGVLIMSGRPF